ncbi:unnamed protein product [Mesocestoides corti]|uniref:NADH dehydrogenase [ubiquinone] 1 beta subcomplex subunit 9 n=1 Tax=Mesocestoides corti TaxID=53468 RepID=A0A0R3UCD4_MESCO|nr:unnamed protein product [Mesocestoides corti]
MAKPLPPAYLRTKFEAVQLRARFDQNKNVTDPVKAKKLVEDGWAELQKNKAAFPFLYPTSPGGVAYERHDYHSPDYLLDLWHPVEKLQYPDYFALREKRKAEFIERWKARYGEPEPDSGH